MTATTVAPRLASRSSAATTSSPPLVTAAWLGAHLDSVVVIDTRSIDDYLDGHVAGAIAFPLGSLLVEDTSHSSIELLATAARQALAARGIRASDRVVLVDDGGGSACLGVFICELAGVRSASALVGGIRAWAATGAELDVAPSTRSSSEFGGAARPEAVVSFEELVAAAGGAARLLDARSQLEHEGIVGTQCCAGRGHIPGSAHLEWSSLIALTGELHTSARIGEAAQQIGIGPDDAVVVYCHSGHRAAFAALALRSAGISRARISIGSWHEWSMRGMPSSLDLD